MNIVHFDIFKNNIIYWQYNINFTIVAQNDHELIQSVSKYYHKFYLLIAKYTNFANVQQNNHSLYLVSHNKMAYFEKKSAKVNPILVNTHGGVE